MFEDADGRGWLLNPNSLAELLTPELEGRTSGRFG
jgi:hypothetical protein